MKLYIIKATDSEIYWNELLGWVLTVEKATTYVKKNRELIRKLRLYAGTTKLKWIVRQWNKGW